jgi:NAD(P)-dependent dehydrogenase (short-subunit alcohol dehydrogenase family)
MTTEQKPLGSGFGSKTTAREVLVGLDLTGHTAIVTGGYSGLGLETTRALAEAGADVIVPARTEEKARKALAGIPRVELETLELIDPDSVDAFASRFVESGRPLDILINNAGIMAPPLSRDARGYESQFATNHLGHFQLTARLWPALKRADKARVVSVSSTAIAVGSVDFEDPNYEHREYNKWQAYGQSKTANALFAVALDKRGEPFGIRAFSAHPGVIPTDLARFLPQEELGFEGEMKTTEEGAATSVWCATSPQLEGKGGVYCMDVDIAKVDSDFCARAPGQEPEGVLPWATDPDLAERLWTLSERMCGIQFNV